MILIWYLGDDLELLNMFFSFLLCLISLDLGNLFGTKPLARPFTAQVWIMLLTCKDGRHDSGGELLIFLLCFIFGLPNTFGPFIETSQTYFWVLVGCMNLKQL